MKARKMLALVLALVITLGMMPGIAFAETIEDDYVAWTDSPNGTYSSLQAAIDAVDDGAIVYLNSPEGEENVTYLGTGVVINKNVTIDLNGCTYVLDKPTVGSSGTETLGFQILKGNNVTITNGTITATANAGLYEDGQKVKDLKMIIQNYSNLTLKDVLLIGNYENSKIEYVLSNNCGEVKLIGNTTIYAPGGKVALDSCKYASYTAPTVIIDTEGEIHGSLEVTGGTLKVKNGIFSDLQNAVTYADDNAYIKIPCDMVGSGIVVPSEKDLTIDLNGSTYTIGQPTVGSSGTETLGFQLLKNSNVTIKNGTITGTANSGNDELDKELKMMIQNYANLTLDDVILEADYEDSKILYVVSNNNGDTTIKGSTNIFAPDDAVAFDVYYSNSYPDGVSVTIEEGMNGIILGKIEVSENEKAQLSIAGGRFAKHFTGELKEAWIAEGYSVIETDDEYLIAGSDVVASIYGTMFTSLEDAISQTLMDEYEIIILKDCALSSTITIPADKDVTIDLNGNEVSFETATSAPAVKNVGTLTIKDNGNGGKLAYKYVGSVDGGVATNAITNLGTLTIDGGTISNTTTANGQIGYAIDNNSGTANATLTVNGGTISATGSYYYDSIRQFANSTTNTNYVVVNGGETGSIWLQNPSDGSGTTNTKPMKGSLVVKGGTTGAIYWEASNEFKVSIEGGNIASLSIHSSESTGDPVQVAPTKVVKGGTFTSDPTPYVDTTKYNVTQGEGTWTVAAKPATPSRPSGGNTSSSTTTDTTKNEDGSTTTTVTDNKTGTVTETTTATDGTTTKVETQKDGTVTETVTNTDGSSTSVETKTDGTKTETQTTATGSTGTTVTDNTGKVTEAKAEISNEAVKEAEKKAEETGEAPVVTLPIAPVEAVAPATETETPDEGEATETPAPVPVTVEVKVPASASKENPVKVEVPVENASAGTVAVLVAADGTETIITNAVNSEDGIVVPLEGDATIKIVDNTPAFTDTDTHWADDAATFVAARGIFNGTSKSTFAPETTMTRGMLMTVLARLDGADTTAEPGEAWYQKGLDWAVENGISDGTNPNAEITREQLATMLHRYVGEPKTDATLDHFHDDDEVSDWAVEAKAWAVELGLITGMGDGTVNPQGDATRAQVATIIERFIRTHQ